MKIWNALKDTEIGMAFSNSQGNDNSYRKKESRLLPRGPRKYFPLGSLIPGFKFSQLRKCNRFKSPIHGTWL